jgi:hypothetical protein
MRERIYMDLEWMSLGIQPTRDLGIFFYPDTCRANSQALEAKAKSKYKPQSSGILQKLESLLLISTERKCTKPFPGMI